MDFSAINQAPEAQAFLQRVATLPKKPAVSLDSVLSPSIEKEIELRRLWAQDRKNYHLFNPFINLVSVFDAPAESGIRLTRARIVKDEEDLAAKYLFPIPAERRRKDFEPCVVNNLKEFQRNWAIFTEGSLSQLTDWNNVIAAGGSVLGCLLPLSPKESESKRTIRKFYHSAAYPTSDVDLFLWGLNTEQAEAKINQIYEAVRDSVPWDVTCVRTKHAISIHSQYPYRSIQIVLRLYQSPAEILAGFDVDAACVAYDGSRILANPRSIVALMRQANTVDMTRRSPSYEVRLAKYASRGFEVYVPDLRRPDVDPTIFERSLNRITGLARLLVLEKLAKPETRVSYLESRRSLRNRVQSRTIYTRRMLRKRKGDLKAEEEIAGLDMNDYDVAQLHIPYGPGWTAQRIEKLIFRTDLGINSTFNPKNKGRKLHRHVAFFGTMKECIEDLCEYCPDPQNDEAKVLQEEEDKIYIRGRIKFIEEDPGRQSMTGSFNPIDIGEWSELAYLGPTEKLFTAIAAKDRNAVEQLLTSGEVDVNRRDHVGRTALQLAVLCSAKDICSDLIDTGARMTARLADGRTALHVAAQMDLPSVIEKMIVRSAQNEEKAKEEEEAKAEAAIKEDNKGKAGSDEDDIDVDSDLERPSSEDDWSSEGEDESKREKMEVEDAAGKSELDADADIPEDNVDVPDILDVNLADWDLALTPLDYAIISGSKGCIQALLNAGADPKFVTRAKDYVAHVIQPLVLAVLISDDARAEEIVEQLIRAGANCAQADERLFSVFHCMVYSGRPRLVEKLLRLDPSADTALNVPLSSQSFIYPVVSAIAEGFYSVAAVLLGYGAKVVVTAEEVQKVKNMLPNRNNQLFGSVNTPHELDYLKDVSLPVETALAYQNYMVRLLVKLGAQTSVPIKAYLNRGRYDTNVRLSLLDCVERQITTREGELAKLEKEQEPCIPIEYSDNPKTFAEAFRAMNEKVRRYNEEDNAASVLQPLFSGQKDEQKKKASDCRRVLVYLQEMKSLLVSAGARTYSQIFADPPNAPPPTEPIKPTLKGVQEETRRMQYVFISGQHWATENVVPQLLDQYDALFEACWTGDNARIEDLCLPRKLSKSDKAPLRITVKIRDGSLTGSHTPLSVAIFARKWDTARLVVSIAKAQYKPEEQKEKKGVIILDEDEDSDDDSTICYSDKDIEFDGNSPQAITDLSTRASTVQCDVSPKVLLEQLIFPRVRRDRKGVLRCGSVLVQACYDDDLEAFINICDMMQQLSEPQDPDMSCLLGAVSCDSPELVDEIIRRTGLGINLHQLDVSEDDKQTAPKLSKLYLGLTVHGKKRKDLARYIEGRQQPGRTENDPPLLWNAVSSNAKKVIEYLNGSGPLAAYRYYAKTKDSERAEALRSFEGLEKQLPKWLGIQPNHRGESALTAVLVNSPGEGRLALAKQLLALFPTQKYLQCSIAFYGWTPLHIAAIENLEPGFFDFFLANGLSAEQTDNKGMNIYHYTCRFGHVDLMNYFIEKLSRDVSSYLIKQKTRDTEETPFMSAVLQGEHKVVETLLRSSLADEVKECLTIRDAKGSMPLHAAVQNGFAKIASLIIEFVPGSEAIYSENGVGETPLEIARTKFLITATREKYPGGSRSYNGDPQQLGISSSCVTPKQESDLNKEVELLKGVYTSLLENGKLAANSKLREALEDFIPYLAEKAYAQAETDNVSEETKEETKDKCDYEKTLKVVSAAVANLGSRRRLVHLTDVQRSVRVSLEKAITKPQCVVENGHSRKRRFLKGDEIPDEMEAEAKEKQEVWNGVLKYSSRLHILV